ncbi:MAG: methionyl-tRNA formyltransferase [Candidatus Marinimicrobia bacterium]|nr:methionyl-tRNA formyltransferase [Candidatus Neomarinimicrobiota bacterium]
MRVIFMGNPEFAVPCLQRLNASSHEVVAVVTNPPKRMGRGKKERISDVHRAAVDLKLPVIFAESLKEASLISRLTDLSPGLFAVVAYRILPKKLLAIPVVGSVNLHGSLLPAYRGAAPIQRAIMNGDSSTGLTTFLLDTKVDTGKILIQKKMEITSEDTYGTMSEKMSIAGAELLTKTMDAIETKTVQLTSQDHSSATSAPKIRPEEREINWSNSAKIIRNIVRGITPVPGAFTTKDSTRIKILKTGVVSSTKHKATPGTVTELTKTSLIVQTGDGSLSILSLQREGKKKMEIADFLKGSFLKLGDILGT